MEIYVVGGFIRDTLMGLKPKDMDFVIVGATPDEALQFSNGHGLEFKKVGADFPVYLDKHGREWALARKERKVGKGYKGFECDYDPSVTIEEDLFRRDLTINAIACKAVWSSADTLIPSRQDIVDPYGGQKDISNKVLRHVSDHFKEDPVRVLRVARFAARFGPEFIVAKETHKLIHSMCNTGELGTLVHERVWAELEKALNEKHPYLFFSTLMETPACRVIFPIMNTFINDDIGNAITTAGHIREKVAILLYSITNNYDILLYQKFVPAKIMKFAILFNKLYRVLKNRKHEMTAECVIDIFERFAVFKNQYLLKDAVLTAANLTNEEKLFDSVTCLYNIFASVQDICYNNLSVDQKEKLVGPEIGAAIWNLRKEVIISKFEK